MEPRISRVTLGVSDLARLRAFYEALGWRASGASQPTIVFFQGNGMALALYGRAALAADATVQDTPTGFAAVTLAHNARSEAEVDAIFAAAAAAGARAVKTPHKVFWGGYSGYFADPDGHLWEVAFNPMFPLGERGDLMLPE